MQKEYDDETNIKRCMTFEGIFELRIHGRNDDGNIESFAFTGLSGCGNFDVQLKRIRALRTSCDILNRCIDSLEIEKYKCYQMFLCGLLSTGSLSNMYVNVSTCFFFIFSQTNNSQV